MMTLVQLNMLKTVAEQGTLKAASELIFKTQAAISQSIKQLEQQLGVQLFDRQNYRLMLTSQGQQIYRQALKLLEQAQNIENLSQHFAAGNEASITLAFEGSFDLSLILADLAKLQNEFGDTQIILRQEFVTGALNALEDDKSDIIITPSDPSVAVKSHLHAVPLHRDALVNVAAPQLLSRHPNLRHVSELLNEYQIVLQDSGSGSQGITYGVQDGQRCWYVNDIATKRTLTLSGMGWGKLPRYLIGDDLRSGQLQTLNLVDAKNTLEVTYYAIKQRSKLLGPVASKLWQRLTTLL